MLCFYTNKLDQQPIHLRSVCGTGSLGRGTPSQSRSGREELGMDSQHGRKLMEYIAFISESLEHEINSMKGRHGGGLGAFWNFQKMGGIWSSGELILVDSRLCRGQRMAVPKAMLGKSLVETRAVLNGQDLVVLKDVTFFFVHS